MGPSGSPAHAGIDPAREPPTNWPRRLPRACGDRPTFTLPARGGCTAPPRMRGSTLRHRRQPQRPRGSPAHAGIDPVGDGAVRSRRGLPRACGDRPATLAGARSSVAAPPRMRGSTRLWRRPAAARGGSPAHAGIDPSPRQCRRRRRRLPRACGDRPDVLLLTRQHIVAPPRMRGSTHLRCDALGRRGGSPAHAGIDPPTRRRSRLRRWLPRACGDRPLAHILTTLALAAPPRMRGSTPVRGGRCRGHAGSPAHAGIDPKRGASRSGGSGLPRACGDRPPRAAACFIRQRAPPRMRGSTHAEQRAERNAVGSPAHAGIDPMRASGSSQGIGLPRACGDRPATGLVSYILYGAPPRMRGSTRPARRLPPAVAGSPAHAGIDLARWRCAPCPRGLPRACGDRPPSDYVVGVGVWAPPRMRGSTLFHRDLVDDARGSPAHAGIDPATASRSRRGTGLPRACGDRPGVWLTVDVDTGAPPRMRGSTPGGRPTRHARRGSPAHAGIDPRAGAGAVVSVRLPRACGDRPARAARCCSSCGAPPRMRGSTPSATPA